MKNFSRQLFKRLQEAQDNCCAICNKSFSQTVAMVNSDKTTDLVRGLLCEKCSLALASFNEDPKLLEKAAAYIKGGSICS